MKFSVKGRRIAIDGFGVQFPWHGDDVEWIWPWRRVTLSKRYISYGFNGVFTSLKEIDNLWEDYFEDLRKRPIDDSDKDWHNPPAS